MSPNYTSIWQEFCCDLIEDRNREVLEEDYQKTVEYNLRQLGWSKMKGEICPKERINVGSHNQIEPDLILKKDGEVNVVIEMKRPTNKVVPRQEQQLLSYMRLLNLPFGLYIGHEIRLYADVNEELPLMVWHTPIELDAEEGQNFVDMFLCKTFSKQRIENFCKDRVSQLLTQRNLKNLKNRIKINPNLVIREILHNYLIKDKKCAIDQVDDFLESIFFSAVDSKINTTKNSAASDSTQKGVRDFTKYSLDGGRTYFVKRRFVREVIIKYMKQNPQVTFAELQQVFHKKMQGTYGVIRSIDSINSSSHNSSDLNTRYLVKPDLLLHSADGVEFAVCSQWGSNNFPRILALLETWGWEVKKSE